MNTRLHWSAYFKFRAIPWVLFWIAFVPRAIHPVSRPLVWYLRSARFVNSVLEADWANTVYSEHPGVSLMWPTGVGLKLYWALSGVTPAADSVPAEVDPVNYFGPVPINEIVAAVLPVVLLIALGVVGIYFLLRALLDETSAAVASLLIALTPYYTAQSKILHLEALLATVMFLSGLAILVYLRQRRWRWLVLGGIFGGLGWLTKPTALYLLPYTALALGLGVMDPAYRRWRTQGARAALAGLWRDFLLPLVAWVVVAALVFVLLWPVMWVDPGKGIDAIRWGLSLHVSTAHDAPNFFAGQITTEDPGPAFYGAVLLFKSTTVELTFVAVALLVGGFTLARRREVSPAGQVHLMIVAFAFFYLVQMNLGAKKLDRYMLLVILCFDVWAAAGIVGWARSLARDPKFYGILLALPLLAQAGPSLVYHPYYSVAYNWLAGGPPTAARVLLTGTEGEGLDRVAAHLNRRGDVQELTIATQLSHVFSQYFRGHTVDINQPADYVLFHRNYTVRDYKADQWTGLWERYSPREPALQIDFDGVPFAWLYSALTPTSPPGHSLEVVLGNTIHLDGYDLRANDLAPGERFSFVLYWRTDSPLSRDLSVFVHLLGPRGQLITQDDSGPAHGSRPTYAWAPGESVADPHTLSLPLQAPPGQYRLVVGLYDWQTGERLPVVVSGAQATDHLDLAELTVARSITPASAWVARLLSGSVVGVAFLSLWLRRQNRDLRIQPSLVK